MQTDYVSVEFGSVKIWYCINALEWKSNCNTDDSSNIWKCSLLQENLIQNCGLNALFSITLQTNSGVTP